jgi:putative toxin-antitoxin system antitoxin component (TIGR02293 family)
MGKETFCNEYIVISLTANCFFESAHPQPVKKSDVIAEISEKTGIDKTDVTQTLETFFSVVKDLLADGELIYVREFDVLFKKKHPPRGLRLKHVLRYGDHTLVERVATADSTVINIKQIADRLGVTPSQVFQFVRYPDSPGLSDGLIKLRELADYGISIFQNQDNFIQWLHRPLPLLNNQSPFDQLHTAAGRQQVSDILGRIEAGVYS